jgi:hypothetical protein
VPGVVGSNGCGAGGQSARQVSDLKNLWRGLQPLSKAFWGYYIVGVVVSFAVVCAIGGLVIYGAASIVPVVRPAVYVIGCIIIWAYWITASVGVWRSANAAKAGSLRIVAKIVVGLFAAIEVIVVISGGASDFVAIITKELSK